MERAKEISRVSEKSFLKIHPDDNVLVALKDLPAGSSIILNGDSFHLREDVKAKHKFFVTDMDKDDNVIMYGALMGKLQCDVLKGHVMNTGNTRHASEKYSYRTQSWQWQPPDVSKFIKRTFNGYKRSDGRVCSANYWLFI